MSDQYKFGRVNSIYDKLQLAARMRDEFQSIGRTDKMEVWDREIEILTECLNEERKRLEEPMPF